jgi:hypothetical protein
VNPPAPEPWDNKIPPGSAPILGTGNPYASLPAIDLSEATFDKVADINPERLASVLAEVAELTQSNLADKAKWNNYLRILELTLRSAGFAVRLAAVV